MEKTKKRQIRNKMGILMFLLWVMSGTLILTVAAATSGDGSTGANGFSWSWSTNNTNTNAAGTFDASLSGTTLVCDISASSSTHVDATSGSCGSSGTPEKVAMSTTVTATVTNKTGSTIRITGITSEAATTNLAVDGMLESGASFNITLTANPKNTTDKTSRTASGQVTITYTVVENIDIVFYGTANATFTCGDVTVTGAGNYTTATHTPGTTITLPEVTVSSGTFYGWRMSDGSIQQPGAAVTVNSDSVIYPVVLSGNEAYPYTVNGTTYCFWEDAVYAAGASGTIILNQDYTLPNTLTANGVSPEGGKFVKGTDGAISCIVPSGVTLLIPNDLANTVYTTKPGGEKSYNTSPSIYRTLTIASGANITVNGAISIAGMQCSYHNGGYNNGAACGPLGYIHMKEGSKITVNAGANLYAWGYITGSGTIDVYGSVYEDLQIADWRGGDALSKIYNNSLGIMPLSMFYVQNIQVPMTLHHGATENVNTSASATLMGHKQFGCVFMGTGGVVNLNDSTASITKDYDEVNDRTVFTVKGNCSIGGISISVPTGYSANVSIDSTKFYMPVNTTWDFIVESNSNVTVSQNIALLPGSTFIIESGATVSSAEDAKLCVYDADDWGKYVFYASPDADHKHIPARLKDYSIHSHSDEVERDAMIEVNGILNISKGNFYTTTAGANICSTGNGQIILRTNAETNVYQYQQIDDPGDSGSDDYKKLESVAIPVVSAQLKNADGTYLQSAAGTYNYCADHGVWYTGECEACNGCVHVGMTHVDATAKTCTTDGNTEYWHCETCGSYFSDEAATVPIEENSWIIKATGHTEVTDAAVEPECNTTGLTEGKHCSVCGTTTIPQTEVAALGHKWDDGTVITAATCGTPGKMGYTCTRDNCGHTKEEVIPATGNHTEESIPGTDPTCTSTGLTEGKQCSICGQVTQAQKEIPMTAHTEETLVAVDATCTLSGLTEGKKCSVCGTTIVAQETIPALGHTEQTVSGKAPTCTEDGLTEGKICTVCGETTVNQEAIPAAGHKWEKGICTVCRASSETLCEHIEKDSVVTAPTCTAKGYTTHTCKTCGYSYIDTYTDAQGHTPGDAATCTAAQTCTVCGTELAAATGHNYSSKVTAPTCTESGYTTHTCANCGDSYTDTAVEAKGHTPGESTTVRTEPTCTEEGSIVILTSCSICGEEIKRETTSLTALGHMEVIDPAVAPTCSTPGATEGKHCSVCDEVLVAPEEIPMLDHSYQPVVTEPTCTEAGYTTHTCANCGDSYVDGETEAVGHKYTSSTVLPTCSDAGYTQHTCTQCGDSYRDSEVAASGHNYIASVTEATCNNGGYTTYTCAVCGSSYIGNETEALGHAYVDGVCTRCGAEEEAIGTITPYIATLKLESLVYMNIYSVMDGFDGIDLAQNMGLLVWTDTETDYSEELMVVGSDHVTAYHGASRNSSYYCVQSGGITAKELGDEFHLRVYVKASENSYLYSSAFTYGPQVYALNKLKTATSADNPESLKKLVVSMLDYGAAAQIYFGYKPDDLANNIDQTYLNTYRTEYNASMLQAVTAADPSVVGDWSRDRVNCPNVIGSLILKGIITNNFSFKFTEEIMSSIDTAKCLFWDAAAYAQLESDGTPFSETNATLSLELAKDPADGYLKAGYDKTAVKNLGDTLYVCAVVTTTDGSTYQSGVISYSGHAYIKNKVGDTNEELVDLVKCLTVYSDTAKIHFASQE